MPVPIATAEADLPEELLRGRNDVDESDDPQAAASRGAGSITARLRRAIETGVYADGDRLPPERQLALAFGTARSTIRKSLEQLERKGLVARRVGSGTFITFAGPVQESLADVTDLISPLQLIETRIAFEPAMARLAAIHASSRDLDRIDGVLAQLAAAEADQDRFTALDSEFHLSIARASHNPLILRLYRQIDTVRAHAQWERMKQIILTPEKMNLYNRQHRAILDALRRRDPGAAADLLNRHLDTARQDLVRADSI